MDLQDLAREAKILALAILFAVFAFGFLAGAWLEKFIGCS